MKKEPIRTTKVPMPAQAPEARARNFDEVEQGYTLAMAKEEAARCLQCKHQPCVSGCPVEVRIPQFIGKILRDDPAGAYEEIAKTNVLPAVCGRVCPQESQCEARCVRGIKHEPVGIGRLERFVGDWKRQHPDPPATAEPEGPKVAIVGSGPSGLSCAGDLVQAGCRVTIYEAFHRGGGVLAYGIPEFRLPEEIVRQEIESLTARGVTLKLNMVIGMILSVDELMDDYGYEAVYISSGAGLPHFLNIPGENSVGVYSANEYLTRINLMRAYDPEYETPIRPAREVTVIGGGNVAMDAARTALRLGAEKVSIVYRRSREEMPARREEVEHAAEEGILFCTHRSPLEILADDGGEVTGLRVQKMRPGPEDASGRRRPIPVDGEEETLPCDTVIIAVGTSPNPLVTATTEGLETDARGRIVTDDKGATSRPGVYAGGDIVTGAATVISAMGAGKRAARAVLEYLGMSDETTTETVTADDD